MAVSIVSESASKCPAITAEDDFLAQLTAHQSALRGYVASLLPGDCEVPDVVQKANLVIWNKRAKFQRGTNFRAWALSIAYWEARAWMTSRKRKGWLVYLEKPVEAADEDYYSESILKSEQSDSFAVLHHCLERLPEGDRQVITRFYFEDKSVAECSEELGRSCEAIKSHLHRIRGTLRRAITSPLVLNRVTS